MATSIKNVIVVGASGNLGAPILVELLKGGFNVSALSRAESQAKFPSNVNVIRSDFNAASLVDAFQNQDAVISAVGSAALDDQKKLVDAAIKAKVKVFLPSDFGSNTADATVQKLLPFSTGKTDTVEYLKAREDQISWIAVITGPFFEMCLNIGALGIDLGQKKATLYDGGDVPVTVSSFPQVGRGVVSALRHLDVAANKYIYISSTTLTQNELLAAAENLTGSKFEVTHAGTAELSESGYAKLQAHDYSGILSLLQSVWFGKTANLGDHRALLWDEKLGLHAEPVEELLKNVLQ